MSSGVDLDALYSRQLREWARRVRNDRRLSGAMLTVERRSPVCGSHILLDVNLLDGAISALGYQLRACTLGMAATAMIAARAVGMTPAEIAGVGGWLRQSLAGDEGEPAEGWQDLRLFRAARDLPERHGSILLPFEAMAEIAAMTVRPL